MAICLDLCWMFSMLCFDILTNPDAGKQYQGAFCYVNRYKKYT